MGNLGQLRRVPCTQALSQELVQRLAAGSHSGSAPTAVKVRRVEARVGSSGWGGGVGWMGAGLGNPGWAR